jgi:lipoyl(octanoyl) transferase
MIFDASSDQTPRICRWEVLGLVDYQTAWDYQRSLVAERIADPTLEDVLLLLEHPPVYTLGTGSTQDFLKFDPQNDPYEIHRIERGGEVTYHCPGQLVGYPILNLRHYEQDLHWYLRQLEEVILQLLQSYGLPAERLSGLTGVWVEGYKLAAIGIKVSRWITMHGFAINVCPDLTGFTRIIPCGISDKPVGSLAQFLPEITMKQVQDDIVRMFAQVFQVNLLPRSKILKSKRCVK